MNLESMGAAPRPPHLHRTLSDMSIRTRHIDLHFFFSFLDLHLFGPIRADLGQVALV